MKFSIRLKDLREKNELSQSELAEILGVGVSTVGMWESTDRLPNAKTMQKIIKLFHCSCEYLLGETDDLGTSVASFATSQLSADEQEVLSLYGSLSPSRKEDLKIYLRALSSAGAKLEKKKT